MGCGGRSCELVSNLKNEQSGFIPPVTLESLDDFKEYAKQAALVLYKPEYFQSPFMDDKKRVSRVTLTAVGIVVKDVPLTFKHVLDYEAFSDPTKNWEEQTAQADRFLTDLVATLVASSNLVRGSVETEHALGQALVARP